MQEERQQLIYILYINSTLPDRSGGLFRAHHWLGWRGLLRVGRLTVLIRFLVILKPKMFILIIKY